MVGGNLYSWGLLAYLGWLFEFLEEISFFCVLERIFSSAKVIEGKVS